MVNFTFEKKVDECCCDVIGLAGDSFHFLPNGDVPPKYRILNYKRTSATNYSWVTVGTYEDGNLTVCIKILYNLTNKDTI